MWRRLVCGSLIAICWLPATVRDAGATTPWVWPVVGPIIRGFDPPDDPYGAGHRGIDIAAPVATTIVAPEGGVVTFAGKVGGRLFLTIDHGGGVLSTCSFLTAVMVRRGDHVARGQAVALTGWGHADEPVSHLHFGVRLNGTYVDPLLYLGSPSVASLIRLAPLDPSGPTATPSAASRMTHLAYPTTAGAARDRAPGVARDPRARGGGPVAAVPGRRSANGARARRHARTPVRRVVARPDRHR